jgi:hypothetical protein
MSASQGERMTKLKGGLQAFSYESSPTLTMENADDIVAAL